MTLTEGAPGVALWMSKDNAATWTPMRGFPFRNAQRVTFDRADPDRIYVTTFGGSVWLGPAQEMPPHAKEELPVTTSTEPGG